MKEQIREIIQSKNLRDISMDILEKVLDNEIGNDMLKEIPLLKSIVGMLMISICKGFSERVPASIAAS